MTISFPILVLLRLLRQLCRVRYYVRDKLAEALGVLRGNDRLAGFGFQRFSCHTRDIAAAPGDLLVFVKALRLLGFRKSAAPLLSAIKKNADIPLIAKLADAKSYLSDDACALLSKDIFAADVYRLALTAKTGKHLPNEFSHSPIVF